MTALSRRSLLKAAGGLAGVPLGAHALWGRRPDGAGGTRDHAHVRGLRPLPAHRYRRCQAGRHDAALDQRRSERDAPPRHAGSRRGRRRELARPARDADRGRRSITGRDPRLPAAQLHGSRYLRREGIDADATDSQRPAAGHLQLGRKRRGLVPAPGALLRTGSGEDLLGGRRRGFNGRSQYRRHVAVTCDARTQRAVADRPHRGERNRSDFHAASTGEVPRQRWTSRAPHARLSARRAEVLQRDALLPAAARSA